MDKKSKISVMGGQMNFPKLTSKLNEENYSITKVHIWLYMLNDGMLPKKWLKANSKGTKVNFDSIQSPADYEKGLIDLQVFIDEVNEKFGTDFTLKRENEVK